MLGVRPSPDSQQYIVLAHRRSPGDHSGNIHKVRKPFLNSQRTGFFWLSDETDIIFQPEKIIRMIRTILLSHDATSHHGETRKTTTLAAACHQTSKRVSTARPTYVCRQCIKISSVIW